MELRPLRDHDRAPLQSLLERIESFAPAEVQVALELVDLALTRPEQLDYRFVVAELEGALAGYLCFGPTPMTSGTFDLYWIAVDPSRQATGIGGALVRAMESTLRAEHGRLVRVETSGRGEYERTRGFYSRNGYDEVARVRDFYEPGDDLVILGKRIG